MIDNRGDTSTEPVQWRAIARTIDLTIVAQSNQATCGLRLDRRSQKIANNRPGLLDKLRQACGTPLGTVTLVPGATSNILSSTATLYVPSRTTKCSSSF